MANDTNKIKLLVLWDILCKNTDENHAMNADEIREELAKRGISVMRKVVATDIAALNKYGYDGNDTAIKTAFTLVKVTLDAEKTDRENGRRGGIKSREIRKAQDQKPSVAKVIAGGIMAGEMLKSILESQNEQSDEDDEPTENKFEKGGF